MNSLYCANSAIEDKDALKPSILIPDNTHYLPPNILRMKDVQPLVGLSKSYIYRLGKEGRFPKPISIMPNGKSVGWVEHEIHAWLEQRIAERNQEA
jgi:prophage regulatory protein